MRILDLMNILVKDTETLNSYVNKRSYNHIKRPAIDIEFQTLSRIFSQYDGEYKAPRFIDRVVPRVRFTRDDVVVLPFSGGKVSLAIAIRYKNMGKKVHLFHVSNSGVSRYGAEDNIVEVQEQAKLLDMPLHIETTSYAYFDTSIMKHLLIIGLALRFSVEQGYSPYIVYGTFQTAHLCNNNYKTEGMNCIEIISAYEKVARKFNPYIKLVMPYPAYSMVWDELINHKRFIPYVKCNGAIERRVWYIALVDHKLQEETDDSLYMKYIKELKKTLNEAPGDINVLWNKYFFYRIEKSKHYGELMKLPV